MQRLLCAAVSEIGMSSDMSSRNEASLKAPRRARGVCVRRRALILLLIALALSLAVIVRHAARPGEADRLDKAA